MKLVSSKGGPIQPHTQRGLSGAISIAHLNQSESGRRQTACGPREASGHLLTSPVHVCAQVRMEARARAKAAKAAKAKEKERKRAKRSGERARSGRRAQIRAG